ncbi:unannotated protein [freshwater metagenome]|uniref:Unannotated protein n=1 Tax=freshwater metagenome TaxID=449393 RepID=A0A6J6YZP7_9ZZZZ
MPLTTNWEKIVSTSSKRRFRRVSGRIVAAALCATVVGLSGPDAGATVGDTVTFANIGDVPYTSAQTALMANFTAHINADPDVSFVAHSGDFKGGSDVCTDAAFNSTFASFQTFADPFWYTPGDNDWTDCHRNNNGNFQPANRLAKVRSLYFATPGQTTGGTPMAVTTQANSAVVADNVHVENTWFNKKCVTFGAIHSVSSNQGYLDPNYATNSSTYPVETVGEKAARYAEVDARIAADVRWLDAIFAAADANVSDAVVLMMQAEPSLGPVDNDKVFGTEFVDIHNKIYALAASHPNMQVVIAHGDQHNNLWQPNYGGSTAPNIARLENWGSNTGGVLAVTKWQKVTATCGTPGTPATFSVVDQTVQAIPSPVVPEGPLTLGVLTIGGVGAVYLALRGRRRSNSAFA